MENCGIEKGMMGYGRDRRDELENAIRGQR